MLTRKTTRKRGLFCVKVSPSQEGFFSGKMRLPEYFITLPETGLRIIAPEETRRNISMAKNSVNRHEVKQLITWTDQEKTRIKLLNQNPILRKRFPSNEVGRAMMGNVDYERREELLGYAQELKDEIVESWMDLHTNSDIAVVLFGSVAAGLVRRRDHPDPSNIDLAVIGNISDESKNMLFERIRPKRKEIQQKILSGCPYLNTLEQNPGNAGVFIQDKEKLRKNNFQCALEYIASNAYPLFDDHGIWKVIEQEALVYSLNHQQNNLLNEKRSRVIHDYYR